MKWEDDQDYKIIANAGYKKPLDALLRRALEQAKAELVRTCRVCKRELPTLEILVSEEDIKLIRSVIEEK